MREERRNLGLHKLKEGKINRLLIIPTPFYI